MFDCLYNHLTGSVGMRHIAKGWSKVGISELVPGADLGLILTDFLNEQRRRKVVRGFGDMLPQEISWVSEYSDGILANSIFLG